METMTQALLRKPRFPLLDHQRSEGGSINVPSPPSTPQQSINSSISGANMINSPMGRVAQAVIPGGFLLGGSANIGMNNNLGRALGVPMQYGAGSAMGGGNALGAFNQTGLVGSDFTTPGLGYAPVTNNVVTRRHDRFGSPRSESDYGGDGGGMGDQSTGSFGGLDGY